MSWQRTMNNNRSAAPSAESGRTRCSGIIAGPNVYICNECVDAVQRAFCDEEMDSAEQRADTPGTSCPRRRKSRPIMDGYIVGQDEAKIALSVAVYNHYKRIYLRRQIPMWSCRRAIFC